MEIRYPDYYRNFTCLAGSCPDTCCAGWEITIDKKTAKKYREYAKDKTPLGRKLKTRIRRRKILAEGNRCPFLDKNGLCEIYREYGPDALSRTCGRHPRHVEDYGNLHEVMLVLSCPEAARLILSEDWSFHVRENPERMGNSEGIDETLLKKLLSLRERAFRMMEKRERPADERMYRVLAFLHDEQVKLSGRRRGKGTRKEKPETEPESRFSLMADFMAELSGLDVVSPQWPGLLERSRKLLYHSNDSRGRYEADRAAFFKENPGMEAYGERIFVYFLYSFLLTALYDGDVYTKGKMAMFCTLAVEELAMAGWRMRPERAAQAPKDSGQKPDGTLRAGQAGAQDADGALQTADSGLENLLVHASYILARQIENSAENRDALERLLKKREFGIRRIRSVFGPGAVRHGEAGSF